MNPTEPHTTRPGKDSNVRPSGWTRPYTNNNTPRFAWNTPTDAGLDLQSVPVWVQ